MEAVTINCPTPPGNADVVHASSHRGPDDSAQLPDQESVSVVAKRRIMKANALSYPVRRSPRLSCLLPPLPQVVECQDTRDMDKSVAYGAESVDDVDFHGSREGTPENDDCLPPDEPSTVLADRIMRAQDNPSPPPQDFAPPNASYMSEKGSHLLHEVSTPPSPFRAINILERLNQLSFPPLALSQGRRTSLLDDRPELSGYGTNPSGSGVSLHESCLTPVPLEPATLKDLVSIDTFPSSSAQCTVDQPPPQLPQHVYEPTNVVDNSGIDLPSEFVAELHVQPISSSPDPGLFGSTSIHTLNPSSPVIPPPLDDHPLGPLPPLEQHSCSKSSPLTPNAKTPSSALPSGNGQLSSAAEATTSCKKDSDCKGITSTDNSDPTTSKELGGECSTMGARETNTTSPQRLGSLSPHSTNVLDGLCLPSEPSIEQAPAGSSQIKLLSSTPPRTPVPAVIRPDLSRSTVQRPIIAPTPVRANGGAGKSNSPIKFSFEIDDIHRTPARRVPIETSLARVTPSLQKRIQPPMGSDQAQSGRSSTMRVPVFTRPALDDPSRSPAKRILITGLETSLVKGHQAPSSPTRLSPRARSASVEPRPLRPISSRSRSVEPSATILKPDNHGKTRESLFPIVPALPRSGTKLPFPLVPGHRSSSDSPLPIPEEPETTEVGRSENNAILGNVTQSNVISQLRQLSANSRIPRIGNKPYARPLPTNGKSTVGTTTRGKTDAPRALQLARKGSAELPSTKPADDQRLGASLKRKRGAETIGPSDPHPVMIRQVVPGIGKYALKPSKLSSQVQTFPEPSPSKALQPLKFRKVVDGMLSARYPPVKANPTQAEPSESTSSPPSPLSELSSSSSSGEGEGVGEKPLLTANSSARPKSETSGTSRTDNNGRVVEPATDKRSLHQNIGSDKSSSRPRRAARTRRPAQQQYVLDVFSGTTSTRPPPTRRKSQTRAESDGFMGMSATALKTLTASNTTKNQQTIAVLAMEVIRKEGLRPESPTVKVRTILQKQRDERDTRRREREQRKARLSEEPSGLSDTEGQVDLSDRTSLGTRADHDDNNDVMLQKHPRGPGDEEDYETPVRPERAIEPLRLEGVDIMVKQVKQVKWHRGLSTAVYLDEVDSRPKSLPKEAIVRGCLAPTSKNLPLDPLGNLIDTDNRPHPELITEQIVVKKYLYDNDIEPEPIPQKITRSKSKKRS